MAEHNFTVDGGSSIRLKTAGKYCDRDIVVTATGGGSGVTGEFVLCGEATEVTAGAFTQTPMTAVNLPNATRIGESAFMQCNALTSVELPEATSIGGSVFNQCTTLNSIYIPMVTVIARKAFYSCGNLSSIDLPLVHSIGDEAFVCCEKLASIDLPMATIIGDNAFRGCTSIASVNMPLAKEIKEATFQACNALTSVELPEATSIGERAFIACETLTRVDLPEATSIGMEAFYGNTNLDTLILRNTESVCELIVTAVMGTKIVTADGAPTGEGFIYVPTKFYENYVTLIAQQAAMLLMSQGMGEAEAMATAEYIARTILRKIEDYPEICGTTE